MENDVQEKEDKFVRYDNSFNKTSLSILTEIQSDILMAVLEKMGKDLVLDDDGNQCYVARYKFKEIREKINSPHMQAKKIKEVFDLLLKVEVEIFEDGEIFKSNLFTDYLLIDRSTVEIILSSKLTKKLFITKKNYTIIQLDEYVSLKSRYAKELYRLLRQFRHTGILLIKKDSLITALQPPKSYNEYDLIRKVLIPAIEHNKSYFKGLKIVNLEKNGNALPLSCKFTFKKHIRESVEKAVSKNLEGHSAEEIELLKYIMENGGV